MHLRTLLMLMPLLTVPSEALASGAELAAIPLTVRIYGGSRLTETTREEALAVAARALADAGIDTLWRRCDAAGPDDGCASPPSPHELIVRLVSPHTPVSTRVTLGDALVEGGTGSGQLATVYVDRVRSLARAASVEVAKLLGYAIAHELGHLLLSTTAHAPDGLMRARWSEAHIRRARTADWNFTTTEIAVIRARRRGQIVWSE